MKISRVFPPLGSYLLFMFPFPLSFQFFVFLYNFHIAGLVLSIQLLYFSSCQIGLDMHLHLIPLLIWWWTGFFPPQEWFFSAWKYWLAEVSSPGACRQAKARRDRISSSWGTDKVESIFHKVWNEQISGIFPCFVGALWVSLGALIKTTLTSNSALYLIEWQCSQTSLKE